MSYQSVILDEQNYGGLPWAYWPLDEAGGTVAADLMARARGAGYNGTVYGGVALDQRPGPIAREPAGWAALNGSTGYVSCGTLGGLGLALTNGLTIEFWMKSAQLAFGRPAANFNNGSGASVGFDVRLNRYGDTNGIGDIGFLISDKAFNYVFAYTTTGGCNDGNAHHVVCEFVWPNTQAVHVDGQARTLSIQNAGTLQSGQLANFSDPLTLGKTIVDAYAGLLAQVAVYNYPLAAARVKAHYLAGLNGSPDIRLLT